MFTDIIKKTQIGKDVEVSSIYVPPKFGGYHELMIFGGEHDGFQFRCRSKKMLLQNHKEIVQEVKDGTFNPDLER
jgi:hypothetical protein